MKPQQFLILALPSCVKATRTESHRNDTIRLYRNQTWDWTNVICCYSYVTYILSVFATNTLAGLCPLKLKHVEDTSAEPLNSFISSLLLSLYNTLKFWRCSLKARYWLGKKKKTGVSSILFTAPASQPICWPSSQWDAKPWDVSALNPWETPGHSRWGLGRKRVKLNDPYGEQRGDVIMRGVHMLMYVNARQPSPPLVLLSEAAINIPV